MTNKELIDCLTDRLCATCKFHTENGCINWDCVFEAKEQEPKTDTWSIKEVADALERHGFGRLEQEQKTESDCISRELVINYLSSEWNKELRDIIQGIRQLPSVNPAPKMGHWSHDGSHWENRWICSECGYKLFDEQTRFCPNCGAKMEG